jgi:hypothetical protein
VANRLDFGHGPVWPSRQRSHLDQVDSAAGGRAAIRQFAGEHTLRRVVRRLCAQPRHGHFDDLASLPGVVRALQVVDAGGG